MKLTFLGKVLNFGLKDLFVFLDYHIIEDIDQHQTSALMGHIDEINRVFSKPTLKEVL
jgi:hypothetical protein